MKGWPGLHQEVAIGVPDIYKYNVKKIQIKEAFFTLHIHKGGNQQVFNAGRYKNEDFQGIQPYILGKSIENTKVLEFCHNLSF